MATSRLIVKNLPNSASDVKLKELFSSQGIVTDVQLKYTPDGRFRHFGFVGFKTGEEAENARKYFNNTYVGACKIQVEPCANLGDTSKPRAWSKYAAEKSVVAKATKKSKDDENLVGEDGEPVPKRKKKEEEILEKAKADPDFAEFLETHVNKVAWGNDTVLETLESMATGKKEKKKKKKAQDQIDEEQDDSVKKHEEVDKADVQDTEKEEDKDNNKKKKKKTEKVVPEKEFQTVKLRNLPKKARKKDLKAFFAPLSLKSIRIPPNCRGFAYVGLATQEDLLKALKKNKGFILGNQISVIKYESKKHMEDQMASKKSRWEEQEAELDREAETVGESGRIFIRNLPYDTSEDEIRALFDKFGPITEVHLPVDRITRQLKGFGFITFLLPEHAAKAFSELDGSVFHGRMLHLLPSKSKEELSAASINAGSSFKKAKELKQKKTAGSSHNWNTLFLGQNAVAQIIADRYDVRKEELLLDMNDEKNRNVASVGVRMALAETEIIEETKKFLETNGVSLAAFEAANAKAPRSTTCIIAKNLPPRTTAQELNEIFGKHGVMSRIVLPPSGVTGIIEFEEPAEARGAFKKLAYTKFKNLPLYLEWAPCNVFNTVKGEVPNEANGKPVEEQQSSSEPEPKKEQEEPEKHESSAQVPIDENWIPEPDTTLFVKNLNFSTTEPVLKKHFQESGPVYSVTIATKKDSKNPGKLLSMGYGFVQFYRAQDALAALKNQQGAMLENHCLELKRSNRTLSNESTAAARDGKDKEGNDKAGSKILVRNVPFQASKDEILQLFKTFGELKAVRLPTKLDGSGEHRGFCFIDFYTKQEAKRAFDTLSKSTHLYGRRLVLEWAAEDDSVEDIRTKTAKKYDLQTRGAQDSQRATAKTIKRYFDQAPAKKAKDSDDDEDLE